MELSLKAALRPFGVEPPKWHDVGPILRRERSRFPPWMNEQIDELASISRALRKERETAMYGDEELSLPPCQASSKPRITRDSQSPQSGTRHPSPANR
ncbi:conserved hypothetical protein [Candidatus Caldarchaeum subterraneum]|uniref:HEPN domain-containing protein n=1 Tax=Caldiarchaeum subterraneum TaxID=311458 RepID=E6N4R4_CALS0|nr:conserved hypothetical protein [Candidatus Caldarchaeum subterraneum]BAJ50135.1 conserved hypothetical protein [Candidatus Caldarchaeum subterraneum]